MTVNVGALVIGQQPRPDLVNPLRQALPGGCQVIEAGALDDLTAASIPQVKAGTYPLTTRLQDGTLVMVEEAYLVPKLQHALDRLEAQAVVATVLLCAGTFADLQSTRPLVKPYAIGRHVLQLMGIHSIGLIVPIKEQEPAIRLRWQAAGFAVTVWTADLHQQNEAFQLQLQQKIEGNQVDCIVLDYVGHPIEVVRQLQDTAVVPVVDLGQLAISTLAGIL